MSGVLHHSAEGVAERRRDHEDREHLEEVAERGRVLERMGRVDVEEPAAVGAQLLDRYLRGCRAHRDGLGGHPRGIGTERLQQGDRLVRPEGLHDAL